MKGPSQKFDLQVVRDAMHNCDRQNANNKESCTYARGVLVGLVAGLMASTEMGWDDVVQELIPLCPNINTDCIPASWYGAWSHWAKFPKQQNEVRDDG